LGTGAAQLRQATARLLRVAREAPDLDAIAFHCTDGRTLSGRQRLEMITRHWRGHPRNPVRGISGALTGVS